MRKTGIMLALALLSGCASAPVVARPPKQAADDKAPAAVQAVVRSMFGGNINGRGATGGQALVWDDTEKRWEAGSVTAGASATLDTIGSTRGAILYRGAAGWAILAPGTAGFALVSGGAGADPSYAAVSEADTLETVTGRGASTPTLSTFLGKVRSDAGTSTLPSYAGDVATTTGINITDTGNVQVYAASIQKNRMNATLVQFYNDAGIESRNSADSAYDTVSGLSFISGPTPGSPYDVGLQRSDVGLWFVNDGDGVTSADRRDLKLRTLFSEEIDSEGGTLNLDASDVLLPGGTLTSTTLGSSLDLIVTDGVGGEHRVVLTPDVGDWVPDIDGEQSLGILTNQWKQIFAGTATIGTLVVTPRLQSTVATGTAPFTIASTTVSTNLNADLLDGLSSASFVQTGGSGTGIVSVLVTSTNPTTLTSSSAEFIVADTSGGAVEIDLPSLASCTDGRRFVVKRVGGSSVTVDPNASETIDGSSSTITLSANRESLTIVKANSEWNVE